MSRPNACVMAALVALAGAAPVASACDHAHRSVRYVSYPSSHARIVKTVVVAKPTYSAVSLSKVETVAVEAPAPAGETVEPGQTFRAATSFLGSEPGHAILQLGSASMRCEIVNWEDSSVTFTLPNFGLQHDAAARVDLVRPDGRLVRSYDLTIATPADRLEKVVTLEPIAAQPVVPASKPATSADTGGLDLSAPQPPATMTQASLLIAR